MGKGSIDVAKLAGLNALIHVEETMVDQVAQNAVDIQTGSIEERWIGQ